MHGALLPAGYEREDKGGDAFLRTSYDSIPSDSSNKAHYHRIALTPNNYGDNEVIVAVITIGGITYFSSLRAELRSKGYFRYSV